MDHNIRVGTTTCRYSLRFFEQVGASSKLSSASSRIHSFFITTFCTRTLRLRLRTVPTFATAHTFCASGDTSSFLWVVPTYTGILLRGLKLYGKSRT